MRKLIDRWNAYWFAPSTPTTLGVGRALFFALLLAQYAGRDWAAGGYAPLTSWQPVWLFRVLHLGPAGPATLTMLARAWYAVLVFACVGLFTRPAVLASLVLGVYLLGYGNNFGKVGHGDPALVWSTLILAASRCGDACSIDALVRRTRGAREAVASGDYTWPIRMIWLVLALVFCSAGVTKLRRSGLAWVTSDNFAIILLQAHYTIRTPPTNLGLWIARRAWRCHVLAGMALSTEVLFPLALISRRARRVLVPGALLMQIGIALAMGVYFTQFLCLYLFWVPWDRVLRAIATRVSRVTAMQHAPPREGPVAATA